MSEPIPFKRRPHVAPRRPLPRLAVRIHVDDGARPVGRSRTFELSEHALAELLAVVARMEARS
jgi:hypothetical protein